jgi:hypothetical protein
LTEGGKKAPFTKRQAIRLSIGGHIVKDKTFFFGDIEVLRQIQGKNTGMLATATAYELAHPGDFPFETLPNRE